MISSFMKTGALAAIVLAAAISGSSVAMANDSGGEAPAFVQVPADKNGRSTVAQPQRNGVPVLSRIPVLSRLFRSGRSERDARSTVIVVRPQITDMSR